MEGEQCVQEVLPFFHKIQILQNLLCPLFFKVFDRQEETTTQAADENVLEFEDVETENEEPVEELPPSVKLGVGYRKPHYKVCFIEQIVM